MTDVAGGARSFMDDPAFMRIKSPLQTNSCLNELLDRLIPPPNPFATPEMEAEHERRGQLADDLAAYLAYSSDTGQFDRWDFEASLMSDKRVENLFSDRLCEMMDFTDNDLESIWADIALAEADQNAITRRELVNLETVLQKLSKHEHEEAAPALEAVEKLLAR